MPYCGEIYQRDDTAAILGNASWFWWSSSSGTFGVAFVSTTPPWPAHTDVQGIVHPKFKTTELGHVRCLCNVMRCALSSSLWPLSISMAHNIARIECTCWPIPPSWNPRNASSNFCIFDSAPWSIAIGLVLVWDYLCDLCPCQLTKSSGDVANFIYSQHHRKWIIQTKFSTWIHVWGDIDQES